ncbi:hypothetical protein D3C86_1413060 [compost metagenome]
MYLSGERFWLAELAEVAGRPSAKDWREVGIERIWQTLEDGEADTLRRYYLNTEVGRLRFKLAAAESLANTLLNQRVPRPVAIHAPTDWEGLRKYADRLLAVMEKVHDNSGNNTSVATLDELVQEAIDLGVRPGPAEKLWRLTPDAPTSVVAAMVEVMRAFPAARLGSVVYDPQGHWQYRNTLGKEFELDHSALNLDLLDEATDSLGGHPSVFFVVEE